MHLGALAGEEGIVWARIEAEGLDLGATADGPAIRRLLGEEVSGLSVWEAAGRAVLAMSDDPPAELSA